MRRHPLFLLLISLALLLGLGRAVADDLDLVIGSGSIPPNVMFLIDNSYSMRAIMYDDDFEYKKVHPDLCWHGQIEPGSHCPGFGNPSDGCADNGYYDGYDSALAPSVTETCGSETRTIYIDGSYDQTLYPDNYLNWMFSVDPAILEPHTKSRITVAKEIITELVNKYNPDDGMGGYREMVRFGLARFRPNSGGCVLAPIGPNNKANLLNQLWNVMLSFKTPVSEALVDVARYFSGTHEIGAYPKYEFDPIGCGTTQHPPPSPIDDCYRKNFVVIISDGEPSSDTHDYYGGDFMFTIGNADNDSSECSLPFPATCTDDPVHGRDDGWAYDGISGTDWLDDVAYFFYNYDLAPNLDGMQNLITYTIGLALDHPLLEDTANNGGGLYFTSDQADELRIAMDEVLLDIVDRSYSFNAATVPAARTEFGDGFYYTFFTPSLREAFWEGRLEAYRLTPTGEIEDVHGNPAVDPNSAVMVETRVPYWDAGIELRSNAARTLFTTVADARTSFSTANGLLDPNRLGLNVSQVPSYPNHPDSGVDTVGELRDALINYVVGQDAFDEDDDTDFTELRPAVLGDLFHSTPVVVGQPPTYLIREEGFGVSSSGTPFLEEYEDRDRVIYAGANDGMLHAFEAGQFHTGDNLATLDVVEDGYYDMGTGAERFGYVPGMQLDRIRMIPRNSPRSYYYVDGTPAIADAWLGDPGDPDDITKEPDEWATVLVGGMREGGAGYLALDVTDPDDTAGTGPHGPYPKLLWEFDSTDSPHLGDTWSEPVIARVKVKGQAGIGDLCGRNDGDGDCREEWVAIFGGGYTHQGNPNTGAYNAASLAGKAIFVVELDSGDLLASVAYDPLGVDGPDNMTYAIPSNPAVLDLDFDGLVDLIYIGDLGGQLWKWDLSPVGEDADSDGDIDNWDSTVFFQASTETMADASTHYKSFFFPPSVTFNKGSLILGFASGERQDMMYKGDPARDENNRIYLLKDPNPTGPLPAMAYTELDLSDATGLDHDPNPNDMGLYVVGRDGEKFVTNNTIVAGYLITASFLPEEPGVCGGAAGGSYLYILDVSTGQGFFFDAGVTTGDAARRISVGAGMPTDPRVVLSGSGGGGGAKIYMKTSWGGMFQMAAPDPGYPPVELVYWKQNF